MNNQDLKKRLLKNPKFSKEYNKIDTAFEIAEDVINARIKSGLTQKQLADKVGTKQSSIARLESGAQSPSISFLEKIAKALNTELIPPKFKLLLDTATSAQQTVNIAVNAMWLKRVSTEYQLTQSTLSAQDAEDYVYNYPKL